MASTRVLVFVGTEGKYHDHSGQGGFLADLLSGADGIGAELSRDYDVLSQGLGPYDTVLFYTDVGSLTEAQEEGLLSHIQKGAGFFGLHTAAASFRENKRYHAMLNGFFDGHSKYMDFTVSVVDSAHPITRGLADFTVTDELYYLKHDPGRSHRLMEAYDPTVDGTHPMAYTHTCGDGRVFFFALGHDMATLENASFQETLRRGVRWTAGRI